MIQGPWSADLPVGWLVRPLWTEFRRGKKLGDGTEELLSVYRDYGVIPKASRDDNFNKPSEDLSKYQRVSAGDLVVNKMKAWQGSLGVSNHDGIVSPAYFVYRATGDIDRRFAHYLLRSRVYTGYMAAISYGIRPNQWDLDPAQFAETPLLVPPVEEQRAIAGYLDRETAKIDKFIAKNEELIALLTERRVAVVELAIRENAVATATLGILLEGLKDGTHGSFERVESGFPLLGARNVQAGRLSIDGHESTISQADHRSIVANGFPQRGDVLLVIVGATIGKAAVYNLDEPLAFQRSVAFLRPGPLVTSKFLWYLTMTTAFQDEVWLRAKVSAQPGLYLGDVAGIPIALPDLPSQEALTRHLDVATNAIDRSIEVAHQNILLARERRASLISAAVTGKIDVGVAS